MCRREMPWHCESAIERLLHDPAATRAMGLRARQWALTHADIERYAGVLSREVDALRQLPTG